MVGTIETEVALLAMGYARRSEGLAQVYSPVDRVARVGETCLLVLKEDKMHASLRP